MQEEPTLSDEKLRTALEILLGDRTRYGDEWGRVMRAEIRERGMRDFGMSAEEADEQIRETGDLHGITGLEEVLLWQRILENEEKS